MKDIETAEKASEYISKRVEEVEKILKECEELADKFSISFQFNTFAGNEYFGKGSENPLSWQESGGKLEIGMWVSSSDYCS